MNKNVPKYVPIADSPGLVRDTQNNCIINIDQDAYERHKKLKLVKKEKVAKELAQEAKINRLEEEMKDIKGTLKEVLSILKGNQ